ncbi:hypothetical protein [Paenibacillus hamazuiensis]|nr:hypothetical protein [Paenibacillus hamazuiensis]
MIAFATFVNALLAYIANNYKRK